MTSGRSPRGASAWAATLAAVCGFAACLAAWLAGGVSVDVPWAPTLGLRLDLNLDGLAALYALLATGIGTAVFAYGLGVPAAASRARWAARGRRPALLGLDDAVHGLDGRAGVRARPDPAVRLLRSDRGRVVLPDRVRPRPARGARRGAHGAAGDRHQRGGAAARRGAALRRLRDVLAAGAVRARAGRDDDDRRVRADRRRGAGQERAGAAALLAAARDGRAHAGVGVPALGGDGRRGRARARPGPPAARARPGRARRAAGDRAGLDRDRRAARAGPGRAQADPRPLDDLPVRLRRRAVRHGRRQGARAPPRST